MKKKRTYHWQGNTHPPVNPDVQVSPVGQELHADWQVVPKNPVLQAVHEPFAVHVPLEVEPVLELIKTYVVRRERERVRERESDTKGKSTRLSDPTHMNCH